MLPRDDGRHGIAGRHGIIMVAAFRISSNLVQTLKNFMWKIQKNKDTLSYFDDNVRTQVKEKTPMMNIMRAPRSIKSLVARLFN